MVLAILSQDDSNQSKENSWVSVQVAYTRKEISGIQQASKPYGEPRQRQLMLRKASSIFFRAGGVWV
jgi:hypothetical protein